MQKIEKGALNIRFDIGLLKISFRSSSPKPVLRAGESTVQDKIPKPLP